MNFGAYLKLAFPLLALLFGGCSVLPNPDAQDPEPVPAEGGGQVRLPAGALPGAEAVAGWTPSGETQVFDAENLFDLVNGQADSFFAYAFEQVAVGGYENAAGDTLRIEIWRLATPSDAYGLFTTYRSGEPVSMGNEGDADPGRRLDFWQESYFVRLFAFQALPDADLQAFALAVAQALPSGGEQPALLDRLPRDGRAERETIFFREEISIQSHVWLGGQNSLGLGPETAGLLARYDLDGATAHLLLVEYPDAAAAAAGQDALQSGQFNSLVLAEARENLLVAVFGAVGEVAARGLLVAAFEQN